MFEARTSTKNESSDCKQIGVVFGGLISIGNSGCRRSPTLRNAFYKKKVGFEQAY